MVSTQEILIPIMHPKKKQKKKQLQRTDWKVTQKGAQHSFSRLVHRGHSKQDLFTEHEFRKFSEACCRADSPGDVVRGLDHRAAPAATWLWDPSHPHTRHPTSGPHSSPKMRGLSAHALRSPRKPQPSAESFLHGDCVRLEGLPLTLEPFRLSAR